TEAQLMARLAFVLAAVLLLSAMSLVTARFQSRQLFIEFERLAASEKELDIDWRRLQLERAELTRNVRIDELARTEFGMEPVSHERSIYIEQRRDERATLLSEGEQP